MRRRLEVFAVATDAVQIVWRGRGTGTARLELDGHVVDLEPTSSLGAVTVAGLEPGTRYDVVLDGRRAARLRTLERPGGRLLARVATVSDLHVGETGTGHFPRIHSVAGRSDWRRAHPIWCLDAVVDEIARWGPDLLVAKGDLAHHNRADEYAVVVPALRRAGAPLVAMGGNHDGGNQRRSDFETEMERSGLPVRDPFDVRDMGGAVVITADTRIEGHHAGQLATARDGILAAASEAAAAGRTTIVFLHHQLMTTRFPYYIPTGVPKDETLSFCAALSRDAPGTLVSCGHTHRNRARLIEGTWVTEVGSPKDFPGVWASYELYEGGIVQTVWRTEEPRAMAWNELTRTTAGGVWGRWAPGRLEDRCLTTVVTTR